MTSRPPAKRPPSFRSGAFGAALIPGVDFALLPAAGRIIEVCLSVVGGERVALITSRALKGVAEALRVTCDTLGATPKMVVLEDDSPRPHKTLCAAAEQALAWAQASVFCADALPNEKAMRVALLNAVTKYGLRHAHMVGVTQRSVLAGFAVDMQRIASTAKAVRVRVRPSSVLHVKSPAGTDLTVRCDPACRWTEHSGRILAGRWENLPAGELCTCPADVTGVYVATASMGSSFGVAREALRHRPLRMTFERGVLRKLESPEEDLTQEIWRRMRAIPNADRVGLAVLGTNVGVHSPTGDLLTDKTIPGLHLWLGRTLPDETGARWQSDAWVAATAEGADVDLDDTPLIRQGHFVVL